MKNDTTLRVEGMEVLMKNLGLVEAERFIMLIQQGEPFDYTRWREGQYNDKDFDAVYVKAVAHYEKNQKPEKLPATSRKVTASRKPASPRKPVAAKTPVRRRKTTKRLAHA